MNDFEAAARGQRASLAGEFIGPVLADHRNAYLARIAEIATTELDANNRADKLTALSLALKMVSAIETGIATAVQDGEMAQSKILQAESIEKMSVHKRRLLNIAPLR